MKVLQSGLFIAICLAPISMQGMEKQELNERITQLTSARGFANIIKQSLHTSNALNKHEMQRLVSDIIKTKHFSTIDWADVHGIIKQPFIYPNKSFDSIIPLLDTIFKSYPPNTITSKTISGYIDDAGVPFDGSSVREYLNEQISCNSSNKLAHEINNVFDTYNIQ